MDARTSGVHRTRIRKMAVAHLDAHPNAERLPRVVSLDGEEITTVAASFDCAADLQEMGYAVAIVTPTAEQRLAAIVELCQRVDANGGGGYVRTDAILALAMQH